MPMSVRPPSVGAFATDDAGSATLVVLEERVVAGVAPGVRRAVGRVPVEAAVFNGSAPAACP